ncbi:hypothetical protein PG988_011936 [Apiospora saccharicola]
MWTENIGLERPEIRRSIYLQAGLPVGVDIILPPRYLRHGVLSTRCHLAYNLLRTHRAVHDEVADIIYAENCFIANGLYGFSPLRRLPPRWCAKLSSLTIHPCVVKARRLFYLRWADEVPSFPLHVGCIAAWHEAAAHVLTHANRETLDLLLICDTGANEATMDALRPLIDHPGSVRRCHIRLGHVRSRRLCSLARDVAFRAQGMHRDENSKPFRFMDLPPEIRWQILEYTDLVAPLRQVGWRAGRGFSSVWLKPCNCTPAGERDRDEWLRFARCSPEYDTRHTSEACCVRHAGYSPRCQCWSPPGAIMLVSRAMYDMAMATLYGRNRVILLPGEDEIGALLDRPNTGPPDPDDSETESDNESDVWELELFHSGRRESLVEPVHPPLVRQQLGATIFLGAHHRTFRPAALSHLRTLEVVFPHQGPGPFDAGLLQRWRDAVRHLLEQGDVGSLTLIVHMRVALLSPDKNIRARVGGYGRVASRQTLAEAEEPLPGHRSLLEPLQELRDGGLRRLFVFLESEWHWTPPQGCTPKSCEGKQSGVIHDWMRNMEQVLERSVMGQEYDSSDEGKMMERPSQWMVSLFRRI